jgi:putative ABC transport system permease protein
MINDLRYAFRALVKSAGWASIATLTIALGIGANTAIFTVVNALLIRPLPYPESGRLVMVWQDLSARGDRAKEWATPGNFADWKTLGTVFDGVAAMTGWQPTLTGGATPEPLLGEQVSHEYFDVLGIAPMLGRAFAPADDVPNAPRVAVLGHGLWQRRFGSDPGIIGRSILLGGEPHEVIGVMPETFRSAILADAEIWRPRRLDLANPSRGAVVLRIVARLKPAVTTGAAASSAALLAKQLEAAHPDTNKGAGIRIVPLREEVIGDIRPALLLLLGVVAFVLLIACVNVANLLLARGSSRGREFAIRMALGAVRRRIVVQLLTESVLLAGVGGAIGVLLGVWGVEALVALAPSGVPRLNEIGPDFRVLLFAAAATLATGVLFGVFPALQASHTAVTPALNEGGRGAAGPAGLRTRRALIVAETAFAVMLVAGSGLLLRTFLRLQAADLGFNPSGVLSGLVIPPALRPAERGLPPAERAHAAAQQLTAFYDRLHDQVAALPGVTAAALSSVMPLGGDSDMNVFIEGRPLPRSSADELATWYRLISPEYFDVMSIPLRQGRGFARTERSPIVVVSETAARTFWPGEEPLGKRVRFGSQPDASWFSVIAVVGDVKIRGARGESRAEMYLPYWQFPEPGINVVLKTAAAPELLVSPLRHAVQELDPSLAVSNLAPLSDAVATSVAQPRFIALLVALFGALAIALAAVGIYGVMSYTVAQRTPELGVRMALGASQRELFRTVVRDGLVLTVLGVAGGSAFAFAAARAMRALLFGVGPADPVTFAATAVILVVTAALATAVPALRAAAVDPIVALRER